MDNIENEYLMETYNLDDAINKEATKFRVNEEKSIKDVEKIRFEKQVKLKLEKTIRKDKYKKIKGLDDKLLDMYVTETSFILKQIYNEDMKESAYIFEKLDNKKTNQYFLVKNLMKKHILFEETIGLFANREYGFSKFITFDVDSKDTKYLKELIMELKRIGIKESNLLVSNSGNKGYHVDLFFTKNQNKYPTINTIQNFYYKVITEVQNNIMSKYEHLLSVPLDKIIELRPTGYLGCKLPCGKHIGTGNFCNLFGESNLKEKITISNSLKRLEAVQKVNIKQYVRVINNKDVSELKKELKDTFIRKNRKLDIQKIFREYDKEAKIISKLNITRIEKEIKINNIRNTLFEMLKGEILTTSELYEYQEMVGNNIDFDIKSEHMIDSMSAETIRSIVNGKLTARGHRHDVTNESLFYYLKIKGLDEDKAIMLTTKLIVSSGLYEGIQLEKAKAEVIRLAKYIKSKDNKKFGIGYDLKITDSDIEEMLELIKDKKITVNKLYLILALKKASKLKGTSEDMICSDDYLLILSKRKGEITQQAINKLLHSLENDDIIKIRNKENKKTKFENGRFKKDINRIDLLILNNVKKEEEQEYIINSEKDFLNHIANKYSKEKLLTVFSVSTYRRQVQPYVVSDKNKNDSMEDL